VKPADERDAPLAKPIVTRSWIPWGIAGIATVAAIVLATSRGTSDASARPLHVSIDLPPEFELPPGQAETLGISDDGMTVAFNVKIRGQNALVLRRLDSNSFKLIPSGSSAQGTAEVGGSAAFSSDGKWVTFGAEDKLWKVAPGGGAPTPIASSRWAQSAWVGNESVVFTKNYDTGLFKFSAEGQDSTSLTTPDRKKGELGHWWPQVLPDGDHVLFTNYTTPADRSNIEVLSLKTGKRSVVLKGGYFARYVNDHLVFVRGDGLMVIPFNASSLRTSGAATPLSLDVELNPPNGWAAFAVSSTGTLVYRTDAYKHTHLLWSDEGGNEEAAIDSAARYTLAVPSPDNRKIATVRDGDVWVYDRQRKLFTRVTRTEQREVDLMWSPDSKDVIYSRDEPQYDIFRRRADGSTSEERLVTSANDKQSEAITADGQTFIFSESVDGDDLYTMPLNPPAPQSKRAIITGSGNQQSARLSPDGMWLVYSSGESGRAEVYLSPYPVDRGPARQQLSDNGGERPEWGPDGRTIYFSSSGRIHRIRVNPRTGEIGNPELLSRIPAALDWRIGPDGRFLLRRLSKGTERPSINVILNWASSLDAKN
jgi:Tol biopolymer transport system component